MATRSDASSAKAGPARKPVDTATSAAKIVFGFMEISRRRMNAARRKSRARANDTGVRQECGGPRPCQICEIVSRGERIAIAIGRMEIATLGRRIHAVADGATKWPA